MSLFFRLRQWACSHQESVRVVRKGRFVLECLQCFAESPGWDVKKPTSNVIQMNLHRMRNQMRAGSIHSTRHTIVPRRATR